MSSFTPCQKQRTPGWKILVVTGILPKNKTNSVTKFHLKSKFTLKETKERWQPKAIPDPRLGPPLTGGKML